jgi:SAM-dependent methyltransferase
MRKYYEAYDDRYRQVHENQLQWASDRPTELVWEIVEKYGAASDWTILELGCGEGRDAVRLLQLGCRLTATDISPEAIRYCRSRWPEFEANFQVLDCINGVLNEKYDFIYAVAVIHMLVEDEDRSAFYGFIRDHLKENGIALICTMGDGTIDRQSDISTAFELRERIHEGSGQKMLLAGTSCRMVMWKTFLSEMGENNLEVLEHGLTEVPPDFPVMMYALVKSKRIPVALD